MGKQEFSIASLANKITTEADAYKLLETLRWTDGQPDVCPQCGVVGSRCYFLKPMDGSTGRKTRTGANSQRRVWKCGECRKQFSVLTGTIFHGTKIPIRTWLFVIFEVCAAKNSVSAREIERKYSLTAKSAWFMLHRIREAMKMEPLAGLLGGAVQVDETWIGGNPKNRHAKDPREVARKARPGRDGYAASDKQPVVALVHYETRQAHARVIPDVTGRTLLPAIEEVMDTKRTWLTTDGGAGYKQIAAQFAAHEFVDHSAGEYVRGNVSTNLVEGWFSQLKRSIDGTHHHVSTTHLDRYLTQFAWLYTNCKASDSVRMHTLIDNVAGRRLTYRPLGAR
jgi:transposase-like protein